MYFSGFYPQLNLPNILASAINTTLILIYFLQDTSALNKIDKSALLLGLSFVCWFVAEFLYGYYDGILENVYQKYINLIRSKKISYTDLIFTKRLSKESNEYADRKTIENCVLKRLSSNGKSLNAGEEIKYIITNFYNENFLERAIPIELINKHAIRYDTKRYLELLKETYDSITKVFYSQIPQSN